MQYELLKKETSSFKTRIFRKSNPCYNTGPFVEQEPETTSYVSSMKWRQKSTGPRTPSEKPYLLVSHDAKPGNFSSANSDSCWPSGYAQGYLAEAGGFFSDHMPKYGPSGNIQSAPIDLELEGRATLAAMADLGAAEADFGLMLAEYKETTAMLSRFTFGVASSLNETLNKVRKRDALRAFFNLSRDEIVFYKSKRRRLAGDLKASAADLWLTWSFGVKPMFADMEDVANFLYNPPTDKPRLVGRSGDITERVEDQHYHHSHNLTVSYREDKIAKCKLVAEFPIDPINGLARAIGLRDWISLGYEMTPLSWLVDYVVPVGDYLRACSARVNLKFHDGSYSQVNKMDWSASRVPYDWELSRNRGISSSCGGSYFCFRRGTYMEFPLISTLVINNPITELKKVANVLAVGNNLRQKAYNEANRMPRRRNQTRNF